MSAKCNCDIMVNKDNSGKNYSMCQQLSVVDETKTDMEYICLRNED